MLTPLKPTPASLHAMTITTTTMTIISRSMMHLHSHWGEGIFAGLLALFICICCQHVLFRASSHALRGQMS